MGLGQALPNHVDHAFVQAAVEGGAAGDVGLVVPALVAAVRVQVAAEFDDELKRKGGPVGEGGEVFNGWNEGLQRGGEGRGGEVGGERVLQAVQIVVEDRHFAVEVVIEGLRGGGVGVHGLRDGRRHV